MPTMPGDNWNFETGIMQMASGWSLNEAVLGVAAVALVVTLLSAAGAALLSMRGPHPSH